MEYTIAFSYLIASLLFIYGLRCLTHPETARRGMHAAELGMLLAIVGTLLHHEIISYESDHRRIDHRRCHRCSHVSIGCR